MNEPSKAEKDLTRLIKSMKPKLHAEDFVFCTMSQEQYDSAGIKPLCFFHEDEGISVIVNKIDADTYNLSYEQTWARITCSVHSDLTAVGFLAAITQELAKAKISVNAVSAYHHDHLFVQKDDAGRALEILAAIQGSVP